MSPRTSPHHAGVHENSKTGTSHTPNSYGLAPCGRGDLVAQAVECADIPRGGSVAVFGLGPVGQMSSPIAKHRGARVIAIDLVSEPLEMAERHDIERIDVRRVDDVAEAVRELTDGRGTDSVIDAVGMEAGVSRAENLSHRP